MRTFITQDSQGTVFSHTEHNADNVMGELIQAVNWINSAVQVWALSKCLEQNQVGREQIVPETCVASSTDIQKWLVIVWKLDYCDKNEPIWRCEWTPGPIFTSWKAHPIQLHTSPTTFVNLYQSRVTPPPPPIRAKYWKVHILSDGQVMQQTLLNSTQCNCLTSAFLLQKWANHLMKSPLHAQMCSLNQEL